MKDLTASEGSATDAASAPDIRRIFAALREMAEVLETDVVRKSQGQADSSEIDALQRRMLQIEQRLELIEKTIIAMDLRFNALCSGAMPGSDF